MRRKKRQIQLLTEIAAAANALRREMRHPLRDGAMVEVNLVWLEEALREYRV